MLWNAFDDTIPSPGNMLIFRYNNAETFSIVSSDNKFMFWTSATGLVSSEQSIPTNRWSHFATTYDKDSSKRSKNMMEIKVMQIKFKISATLKLYVNGILVRTESNISGIGENHNEISIGMDAQSAAPLQCFCHVNDIAVYGRALSHEEITKTYAR